MDIHVEETVRNCQYCTNSDNSYTCHTTPLHPVQLSDKVWQKLAVDIMRPFNDPKHKFVIVLVDYYSKWCEVAFETEVTTDKMIQLLDYVLSREWLPEFVVTDNGVQLTPHKMKEFLKGNGITHLHTSLYHPQTNGLVERMNRTVYADRHVRGQISTSSYTGETKCVSHNSKYYYRKDSFSVNEGQMCYNKTPDNSR